MVGRVIDHVLELLAEGKRERVALDAAVADEGRERLIV
jgi:hypothetical protein